MGVIPASRGGHNPSDRTGMFVRNGSQNPGGSASARGARPSEFFWVLASAISVLTCFFDLLQKVGRYYKIWIRWKGSEELTWRWRHELVSETSNAEILEQIEAAVAHERVRCATVAKDAYAENEEEFIEDVPQVDLAEQPEEPLGRGAPQERKAPTRFAFLMMDTSTAISTMTSTVREIVSTRLRVCTH